MDRRSSNVVEVAREMGTLERVQKLSRDGDLLVSAESRRTCRRKDAAAVDEPCGRRAAAAAMVHASRLSRPYPPFGRCRRQGEIRRLEAKLAERNAAHDQRAGNIGFAAASVCLRTGGVPASAALGSSWPAQSARRRGREKGALRRPSDRQARRGRGASSQALPEKLLRQDLFDGLQGVHAGDEPAAMQHPPVSRLPSARSNASRPDTRS